MHFAFAIINLFPGGGLQRDCVDIARRVDSADMPSRSSRRETRAASPRTCPCASSRSAATPITAGSARSPRRFAKTAAGRFDLLVGFDKLGGLDLLYCSDRSMRARASRNPLLHLLPRYRGYMSLEKECFAPRQRDGNPAVGRVSARRVLERVEDRTEPARHAAADPGRRRGASPNIGRTACGRNGASASAFARMIGFGSRPVSSR